MFTFKKIASQFFMPLPFFLILSLAGLYYLWFTSKKSRGRIFVTAGILSMALASFPPFAELLISPLEKSYKVSQPAVAENIKYVVVLGGGHVYDPSIPPSSRVTYPALVRLVEGISIMRNIPGSKLLLSGGGTESPDTDADTMLAIVLSLGVRKDRIIIESQSKDTKDQARIIKDIVKNDLFILVTSAAHMTRSLALFNNMGMKPLAFPTDFRARDGGKPSGYGYLTPSSDSVEKVEKALHEYLGIIWARFRGQV